MIKHLIIASCVVFGFALNAQEYIPWQSYYVPENITESDTFSFDEHPSIYPAIKNRRINSTKITDLNKHDIELNLIPIVDFVFGNTQKLFQFRTGMGLAMDIKPLRGMHIKAAFIQGFSNTNAINYQGGVYPLAVARRPMNNSKYFMTHDIRARMSYSPNKFFNFQIGIDNNHFGEGDRSLLLGDFGTPYPFAQMRIKLWRMEYVSMQTYLQNPNAQFSHTRPKFSAIHYLSMNLLKGLNLSFFETVVYDGIIGNQRRGVEWEYLNPFVIYRPVEFSLGSTDKVQMGANISYRFTNAVTLYGQVMIDEFKINLLRARERNIANKYGFQLGVKGKKSFPFGRLTYLTEFNLVRPFTYSHGNPGQAFSNMSNPLAHPLGSNFIENATRVLYKTKKWDYSLDFVYYLKGKDLNDSVSWGGDINASYLSSPADANNERIVNGFYIGSGNPIHVTKIQGGVGYELFPKYKTRAFLTLESLWFSNQGKTTNYIGFYLGLRTELWNDRRNY